MMKLLVEVSADSNGNKQVTVRRDDTLTSASTDYKASNAGPAAALAVLEDQISKNA